MARKSSSKTPKTTTPTLPAEHQQQLDLAIRNVQNQVGSGSTAISQAQADAEINRLKGMSYNDIVAANRQANATTGTPGAPSSPQVAPFGVQSINSDTKYSNPGQIFDAQDYANQQNISRQQAINRPGELNAFGASDYIQNPDGTVTRVSGIGNINPLTSQAWTGEQYQNQSYIDRALQAIAGEGGANNQGQAGLLPQLRGMFSSGLDFSKAPQAPDANGYQSDRAHVEDSLYNRFASVNEPRFARDREQFEQTMANRGIPVGSALYNNQLQELNRSQQDARDNARSQAIGMGGQEQQRLFEDTNTLRGNNISEMLTQRNQPLTDLRGLLSAVNPVNMPQFNQTANINVPTTDFSGVADQFLNRANNLEGIKLGGANALALQGLQGEQAKSQQEQGFQNQQALNQQQFGFNQQLNAQNRPSSSSFWGNLGGAALGGFLSGLGGAAGKGAYNWGFGS